MPIWTNGNNFISIDATAFLTIMEKKNSLTGIFMLLIAAFVWGTAFVVQRIATGLMASLAFNAIRTAIGALVLVPVMIVLDAVKKKKGLSVVKFNKETLFGGAICGFVLFFASTLQQIGLETTTAGKSGFITALYVVLVPVIGLLARRKTPIIGWFALPIAVLGFYLLAVGADFGITMGDLLTLMCAVLFSCQILFLDMFDNTDPVKLTFVEFVSAALIGLPWMAIDGATPSPEAFKACILPLLYMGFLSCGVAYTLQTVGQRRVQPALATLLMSLESVFSFFAGIIILHETSGYREIIGCILVFGAVLLAEQTPHKRFLTFVLPRKTASLHRVGTQATPHA